MNNNQYIAALNKALSGLDKTTRNDIIKEIQSHVAESGAPLIERFGTPTELAKQYLDGEVVAKPTSAKILGIGKRLFTIIGIAFVVVVAAATLFIWKLAGDEFNYADESAPELNSNSAEWASIAWNGALTLNLKQAATVFYWHDENTIRWNCLGDRTPKVADNSNIDIKQAKCLVYLPKTAVSIKANQSKIVLVRPQVSVNISIEQVQLKIAENSEKYQYSVNSTRTKFHGFQTHDDAEHTISINSNESEISPYDY